MGRQAEGFRLRKVKGKNWLVRFRIEGQRYEISTGESNRAAAQRKGRAIFGAACAGKLKRKRAIVASSEGLGRVAAQWLDELTIVRENTRDLYEKYVTRWCAEWSHVSDLTDRSIQEFVRGRLRHVRGKTVNNECAALRHFCRWLVEVGHLSEAPAVPSIPKSVTGGVYREKGKVVRRRTKAPPLEPEEVLAILDALPERASLGDYPVRARFIVAYETGLRPSLLDKLRAPDHYSHGATHLDIVALADKELWDRPVPLSKRAREALDSVCPKGMEGEIFGHHKYEVYLQRAAKQALPASKARIFTGAHFRSAAATHLLERTGNLPGVQYLLGHKYSSTTDKYTRASYRAAQAVIDASG